MLSWASFQQKRFSFIDFFLWNPIQPSSIYSGFVVFLAAERDVPVFNQFVFRFFSENLRYFVHFQKSHSHFGVQLFFVVQVVVGDYFFQVVGCNRGILVFQRFVHNFFPFVDVFFLFQFEYIFNFSVGFCRGAEFEPFQFWGLFSDVRISIWSPVSEYVAGRNQFLVDFCANAFIP